MEQLTIGKRAFPPADSAFLFEYTSLAEGSFASGASDVLRKVMKVKKTRRREEFLQKYTLCEPPTLIAEILYLVTNYASLHMYWDKRQQRLMSKPNKSRRKLPLADATVLMYGIVTVKTHAQTIKVTFYAQVLRHCGQVAVDRYVELHNVIFTSVLRHAFLAGRTWFFANVSKEQIPGTSSNNIAGYLRTNSAIMFKLHELFDQINESATQKLCDVIRIGDLM